MTDQKLTKVSIVTVAHIGKTLPVEIEDMIIRYMDLEWEDVQAQALELPKHKPVPRSYDDPYD